MASRARLWGPNLCVFTCVLVVSGSDVACILVKTCQHPKLLWHSAGFVSNFGTKKNFWMCSRDGERY